MRTKQRQPPQVLPTIDVVQPRPAKAEASTETTRKAIVAAETLRGIRSGLTPNDYYSPDGVLLLTRVSYDKACDTTFYHLTNAARELLRAGGCLPWGG
jgi:hypothetical protein